MYENMTLKSKILPEATSTLQTYIRRANSLDIETRDVRPLMSLLKRLPEVDRYLFGLIQTRKLAILGFDYDIKFPEEYTPSAIEEKILLEMKQRFQRTKMRQLGKTIVNGRLFGFSAIRLRWENIAGLGTAVIRREDYDLTELDIDPETRQLYYLEDTNSGYIRRDFDPPVQHILIDDNPFEGIDKTYIGGLIRVNMIYVWLKYWEAWNWAKNNEKYGDPMFWATYLRGASEDEITKLKEGLAELGNSSYAAFSEDVEVNLLETLRNSSAEAHNKFIDQVNKEMAISILGQQLTTDVGKVGSFAAAKVANFVRQDYLLADLLEVADGYDQYLRLDFNANYGDPKESVFPEFVFRLEDQENFEANARIIGELRLASIPLRRDEVYRKTGFTPPQEGDETV